MPADPRIERIATKLAELRRAGKTAFGSERHDFVLDPPLAEEEVRAFEERHHIELPAGFRAFLTQIGSSGDGPYYGLQPMESWIEMLAGPEAPDDFLMRPCLFAPDTKRDDATWAAMTEHTKTPFQGSIAIVDQGCTYYVALAINGPHAGRVLYVNLDGGVPYFPENEDFLSWYERWLDELRWGHVHFWFGTGMPGDEATLASSPRKLDALSAMDRLPSLAQGTRAVVKERLCDDDENVRATALYLTKKFTLRELTDEVRSALSDPSGSVRRAALEALIALESHTLDELRAALRDPDPDTTMIALRTLAKQKTLAFEEVAPLLDGKDERVAAVALDTLRTMPSERAFDLLLHRAKTTRTLPVLQALLSQVQADVKSQARRDAAFDLFVSHLASSPPGETFAVDAIANLASTHPRALETLVDLTRHGDAFVRWEAASMLGTVGRSAAIPALEAMIGDETMPRSPHRGTSWSVGENARQAIEKIRARVKASN
jgi:HEAT repeat protein